MKISRFKISNGFQFDNFEVNLTYPKGHEKEGQPLDKVCFIGQSGTGKTTILEELWLSREIEFNLKKRTTTISKNFKVNIQNHDTEFKIEHTENKRFQENNFFIDGSKTSSENSEWNNLSHIKNLLLYFPEKSHFNQGKIIIDNTPIDPTKLHSYSRKFNNSTSKRLWKQIEKEVSDHTNEKSKFFFEMGNLEHEKQIKKKLIELEEWKLKNPSPLKELAEDFLNPILHPLQLKVKIDLMSLEETKYINLIDKDNNIVPNKVWSTGTKQIIYRTIPLYITKPEESIVFIDEPENSLYPDIQTKIVDHYTRLGKDCQFFFATHSPLIASSFEPWEVVELKFNDKGKVYRDKYYAGENHIDNYFIDPRYLRWDSILTKVFDLEVEGNVEFRSKKLTEFSILKNKLQKLKDNNQLKDPTPETKNLIEEYKKIGKLLDWKSGL